MEFGKAVAYYPKLARIVGGVKGALFLCQILYWQKKSEDGWVFRTQNQLCEETGLSVNEQQSARAKLKAIGILEERYKGMPRQKFYRVNIDKLNELLRNKEVEETRVSDNPIPVENHNKEISYYENPIISNSHNMENPQYVENQYINELPYYGNSVLNNAEKLESKNIDNNIEIKNNNKEISENTGEKQITVEEVTKIAKQIFKPEKEQIDIPGEVDIILPLMWDCGFPRKTLRSEIDRRNLKLLYDYLGSWAAVIEFFKKLKLVKANNLFLGPWDWDKYIKKVDFILNYQPKPKVEIERLSSKQAFIDFFKANNRKIPKQFVRGIVFDWWRFHRFTDISYDGVHKLADSILKAFYSSTEGSENAGQIPQNV